MKRMKYLFAALAALLLLPVPSGAQSQQPQTPEEAEKKLMEFIDKEVSRLSEQLALEYWQEFYVDSTLTHDYHAMQDEIKGLSEAKVGNVDLYQYVQDKWMDRIDNTYERIFTGEQYSKYLKSGGARRQKDRAKRRAKAEKASAQLKGEGK